MQEQPLTIRITKQASLTSLLGLTLLIMGIFVLIFIGGNFLSFMAELTMAIVCLITSVTGKRAGALQTSLYANRYSSWSLTCLLTWSILGTLSSIMQIIVLSEVNPYYKVSFGIVFGFWCVFFVIGLSLLRNFRMVAIMYAKTFAYAQGDPLNNGYPQVYGPPGYQGQPNPNPQFGMPIYGNSGPISQQNGVYVGQPVYMQPDGQQNNFRPIPPVNNQYLPPGGASGNNQYLPPGGGLGNNQYLPPGGALGNNQYLPPGMIPANPQNLPPGQNNPQYLPPPQIPPN
ncbi:hypothetical protein SteCoe_18203 [Stentor coeruleus]|uniref:Uncharacterized protein n=1 Tax=Stentor coeruleus TaxID=5963 RepID=A0A1R2BX36_9CILI|nr:hypothetical protein SteCoe_18203 [Stentor coeruleus]